MISRTGSSGETPRARDVHQRLAARAADGRRSLSVLIRAEIVEIARRPTMSEMLDRLAERPVTTVPESAADALAAERVGIWAR